MNRGSTNYLAIRYREAGKCSRTTNPTTLTITFEKFLNRATVTIHGTTPPSRTIIKTQYRVYPLPLHFGRQPDTPTRIHRNGKQDNGSVRTPFH